MVKISRANGNKRKAGVATQTIQKRLYNKDCNERQGHHIVIKGVNTARKRNAYENTHTQNRSTTRNKANINRAIGRNQQQFNRL